MTISSTARVAGPFIGADSTATFPFAFKVFEEQDLLLVELDLTLGTIAELTLTADYTVTLNADQDANPGGSVTLTAGNLATGKTLTVTTDIAELQGLDLTNGGGFYPEVINKALDLLTILVQQIQQQANRALQIPFGDASVITQLPAAAVRAGKLLMFDADGNPQLVPVAGGSIVPGAQAALGVVDGLNKTFTFVAPSGSTPAILAFCGGIFQSPVTDYGDPVYVAGTTWSLTFTTAPVNGPVTILMLA